MEAVPPQKILTGVSEPRRLPGMGGISWPIVGSDVEGRSVDTIPSHVRIPKPIGIATIEERGIAVGAVDPSRGQRKTAPVGEYIAQAPPPEQHSRKALPISAEWQFVDGMEGEPVLDIVGGVIDFSLEIAGILDQPDVTGDGSGSAARQGFSPGVRRLEGQTLAESLLGRKNHGIVIGVATGREAEEAVPFRKRHTSGQRTGARWCVIDVERVLEVSRFRSQVLGLENQIRAQLPADAQAPLLCIAVEKIVLLGSAGKPERRSSQEIGRWAPHSSESARRPRTGTFPTSWKVEPR